MNNVAKNNTNNTQITANITAPMVAGVEITTDGEGRFNLNALHKASGLGANKAPAQWLRTKTSRDLISELENQTGQICTVSTDVHICTSPLSSIKGGVNQGTFAHELLAIEYAGWISPAFRLKVNQTFLDYKTGKLQPQIDLNDPEFLRGTLLTYTEKVIALEHKVEEMRPDVEALDRIAKADGSLCMTDSAKTLQIRRKELIDYLSSNKWIYRRVGNKNWLGYQDKAQQGLVEHKVTSQLVDGIERIYEQVRITAKGLTTLSRMLGSRAAI